jgi:3-hydroxyacyl-CoA dehydrogenase|tara:strand:- start:5570 stop:5797 length:228 start_codon:yes stop_codon:yes gene_type:complete
MNKSFELEYTNNHQNSVNEVDDAMRDWLGMPDGLFETFKGDRELFIKALKERNEKLSSDPKLQKLIQEAINKELS